MTCARRMKLQCAVYLLVCLFTATAAFAADDAGGKPPVDYPIHLFRPDKVGDRTTIAADGALIRETSIRDGKEARKITEEGYGIHLDGAVEVLAVRPDGRASEVELTVKKCTGIIGKKGQDKELIAAGKAVIAKGRDDGTDYSLKDGGKLSDEVQAALELVLSLEADDDDHNDDQVIGTLDNHKLGDHWPINSHLAAEDARNEGVDVKDEAMSGEVKLAGVEQIDGVECLKIQGEMDAKEVMPPEAKKAGLPEQMKPAGGSVKYRFAVRVPTDEKAGAMSESGSVRISSAYSGKLSASSGDVRIETTTQRAVQVDRRPAK